MRKLRSRLLLAIVSVFVLACGKQRETVGFDQYVKDFEDVSIRFGRNIKVDDLIVEFADLPQPRTIAECVQETWKTPKIRVDTEKWDQMSPQARSLVIFHEMGHCVLDRRHRSDIRPNGTPASIMHQHNVPEEIFVEDQDYYLRELFQKGPKKIAGPTQRPKRWTLDLPWEPASDKTGGCVDQE